MKTSSTQQTHILFYIQVYLQVKYHYTNATMENVESIQWDKLLTRLHFANSHSMNKTPKRYEEKKKREAYEYRANALLITDMALLYFVFNLLSAHSLIALSISIYSSQKLNLSAQKQKTSIYQFLWIFTTKHVYR